MSVYINLYKSMSVYINLYKFMSIYINSEGQHRVTTKKSLSSIINYLFKHKDYYILT